MGRIKDELEKLKGKNPSEWLKSCFLGIPPEQKARLEQAGCQLYSGKVRELIKQGEDLYVYHTDRLSAFDRYIGVVPYKGVLLCELSAFWFEALKDIAPNPLRSHPHERVLKVKALTPFKVEVIMRGYMAGSMARAYSRGEREFCGNKLPQGLKEFRPLPKPILTPTTKAEAYEHDEEVSSRELIERGVVSEKDWQVIEEMAFKLFSRGQTIYEEKGWMLVDTKYEFGKDSAGQIYVIDEIHTPDSSRLWRASSYEERLLRGEAPEMLDKEQVRRYLLGQGFQGHGPVPEVPSELIFELVRGYLEVGQDLLGEELVVSHQEIPYP